MKSFLGLVGLAVAVGSFGCGTTVNVLGDDGTGGGGGAGSGGSSAEGGTGPGTTTTSTGPNPPPNPPECPSAAPDYYGECSAPDVTCTYAEEQGCTVAYTCILTEDCYGEATGTGAGGYDGGYGGYGDCYQYSYWQPSTASCPGAVDCAVAQNGDVCALPGDYCGSGGECTYEDKWCGEDHRWQVSQYEDECCYDDCCYDGCGCEPYSCPDVLPVQGDYCDPCWDSDYCSYEIPDEYCGYVFATASCNPSTYTWDVYVEGCVGTTVSVATGSGAGGGWEGTGGAGGAFIE